MVSRERAAVSALAVGFAVAVAALSFVLPSSTSANPLLIAVLIAVYALVSRVQFEVYSGFAVPLQLGFIPMLFLAPLPLVPVMVVAGNLLADLPKFLRREAHGERWLYALSDAWFSIGPVLVLGLLASGAPTFDLLGVYVLAFFAQVTSELVAVVVRESWGHGVPLREALQLAWWSLLIDAMLSPIALLVAIVAYDTPAALVAIVPLLWLLAIFSRERRERYAASLELNQAYRGTVMLLSDVVEFEDGYTADHCRSVVDLVNQLADEMKIAESERQELEFAALLHDVGKIAIPKEILNKPSKLTDEEFELIKTHTIEGQVMLDRVGGLLGRVGVVVRSCHERWDGAGYSDGLAGEQIPLPARIVFCCDAYNAMTTDRPYSAAMSDEAALAELRSNAGSQFDPAVVAAVERVIESGVATFRSPVDAVRAVFAGRPQPKKLEVAS